MDTGDQSPGPPGIYFGIARNDDLACGGAEKMRGGLVGPPRWRRSVVPFPVIPGRVASPQSPLAFHRRRGVTATRWRG